LMFSNKLGFILQTRLLFYFKKRPILLYCSNGCEYMRTLKEGEGSIQFTSSLRYLFVKKVSNACNPD
jgi:hypothetical protein